MPIFCEDGFPKDYGASDFADSARLAGMMAIVRMADTPDLSLYVNADGLAVRYPKVDPHNKNSNNPRNFTRDQALPLVAGLMAQKKFDTAKALVLAHKNRGWRGQNTHELYEDKLKPFWAGADLFSPANRLAMMKAANLKPSVLLNIFGHLWLIADMVFASIQPSKYEINQLIAMLYCFKNPLLNHLFIKIHPKFGENLKYYWGGWRAEFQLYRELELALRLNFNY